MRNTRLYASNVPIAIAAVTLLAACGNEHKTVSSVPSAPAQETFVPGTTDLPLETAPSTTIDQEDLTTRLQAAGVAFHVIPIRDLAIAAVVVPLPDNASVIVYTYPSQDTAATDAQSIAAFQCARDLTGQSAVRRVGQHIYLATAPRPAPPDLALFEAVIAAGEGKATADATPVIDPRCRPIDGRAP